MNITENISEVRGKIRDEQGFAAYVLENERIRITVVPELGSRIISLVDVRTGREWMWHPQGGRKLFRNHPQDDFSGSPLVGMDECFPTITPCSWQGRELPDHGELWSKGWSVDEEALRNGSIKTSTVLSLSPFDFERTIELKENEISLRYQIYNRSTVPECFLWAMHPLLRLRAGDELELPRSTCALLNGHGWVDAVDSAIPEGGSAKIFALAVSEGVAAVRNPQTGDRIEFDWNPAENGTLGLWLTRGGWHGHHHFALEPTNSNDDSLAVAAAKNHCGLAPASSSLGWQVRIRIGG